MCSCFQGPTQLRLASLLLEQFGDGDNLTLRIGQRNRTYMHRDTMPVLVPGIQHGLGLLSISQRTGEQTASALAHRSSPRTAMHEDVRVAWTPDYFLAEVARNHFGGGVPIGDTAVESDDVGAYGERVDNLAERIRIDGQHEAVLVNSCRQSGRGT